MTNKKKPDGRKNNGGARPGSGPRVAEQDKKKTVGFAVKNKLISSPEKVFKLRKAVYQFIEEVYEKSVK